MSCATCTDWSIETWLSVALVPAALYAVQNIAALTAYQNLDALTFNVLNQTKTLSAAVCLYFVMGQRQSILQSISLLLLLVAALIMEGVLRMDLLHVLALVHLPVDLPTVRATLLHFHTNTNTINSSTIDDHDDKETTSSWETKHFTHGVAPIMLASFISGLAGALSQKNLQLMGKEGGGKEGGGGGGGGRNAYLFSMELCLASVLVLLLSLFVSSDGQAILEHGFWHDWTVATFIPIFTNSVGGILVGLVTKYAGSVHKGFALILGIFFSGILQTCCLQSSEKGGVRTEQVVGGLLAALALYIHSTCPPRTARATTTTTTATPVKPIKQE
jgi:solute carrier family 35 (UDP-sugar transporter), member A1/2/3